MTKVTKTFPIIAFLIFTLALIGMTLSFQPSWGLMDDRHNIIEIERIHNSPDFFQAVQQDLMSKLMPAGFFRPVYYIWVLFIYSVFYQIPVFAYVILILLNMTALLVWGKVIAEYYAVDDKYRYLTIFLFPLSFFLFTPFWNVFMYLSVQEKFIVWFTALALYHFKRSYDEKGVKHIITTIVFILLALLSKPTGIYLPAIFLGFSLLDLLFFKINISRSKLHAILNGFLLGGYVAFTFAVQLKGSYTSGYKGNLQPLTLLSRIFQGSIIIKGLFVFGVLAFLFWLIAAMRKRTQCTPFVILFPLALLAHIILLAPWGFQSYLLSSMAPLVLSVGFGIYLGLLQHNIVAGVMNVVFVLLLIFCLVGNISPQISRMGEIAKVKQFMRQNATEKKSRYFMLSPCMEAAFSLEGFTEQEVVYRSDSIISNAMLNSQSSNYLLANELCHTGYLKNLERSELLYNNNTWQIIPLRPKVGIEETVMIEFPKTLMQKLKYYLIR